MVDIEPQIFTALYNSIIAKYPKANIVGEYVRELSKFPCVSIEEIHNTSLTNTIDTSGEHHSMVDYEINIYTNNPTGKKSLAKSILKVVDSTMLSLNFRRAESQPAYLEQANIYRIVARYTAIVSNDNIIYRRN